VGKTCGGRGNCLKLRTLINYIRKTTSQMLKSNKKSTGKRGKGIDTSEIITKIKKTCENEEFKGVWGVRRKILQ